MSRSLFNLNKICILLCIVIDFAVLVLEINKYFNFN